MEIPYVVTPRKDTGLFNSKIAIWLFLASEVMLFGGFFSAYVFLRIYADYPWPERSLPVLPGLINTFVLIGSSITVVFAWASLKLRQWHRFQIFMGITIACAAIFMVLKGIEYYTKFHHQAVRLTDYTIVEGHLNHYQDGPLEGKEANRVFFEAGTLAVGTTSYHKPYIEEILAQAEAQGAEIRLTEALLLRTKAGDAPETETIDAGTPLSLELLAKVKALHRKARAHNSELRTLALREEWAKAHEQHPDKGSWQLAPTITVNQQALSGLTLTEAPALGFTVDPPMVFSFPSTLVKATTARLTLKDSTSMNGALQDSPMDLHVDAVDFRHLAMKAEEKGLDPMAEIEKSWILQHSPEIREAWEWHKVQVAQLDEKLLNDYGRDERTGEPRRVATETERYRIGWQDFAAKAEGVARGDAGIRLSEEFMGPDYKGREAAHTFPHLEIPRERVAFESKFTAKWNTYYAIYFTMTALHGIHVIGGALVLGYYLFFGKKMYLANPEWLANRVEVGGLFWHFVDLVWIFLFPILYLM